MGPVNMTIAIRKPKESLVKHRALALSLLAVGVVASSAACSSSSGSTAASAASSAAMSASAAPPASAAASAQQAGASMTDFGPACSAVPATGAGSFTGMAAAPVATAASANPVLSTLVAAVKKAGLVDTLNSAQNITVFAPDNAAFAKIPAATLDKVLDNKAELTKILTYHVVSGRYTPGQLADGAALSTLEGSKVQPALTGSTYTVNGANVVCGNVQTANATVYIIDTVLMPPSS
jgi:uncharacterized surface protein with fasciclin (FAS1) repeats